jgi:hypothetical protein
MEAPWIPGLIHRGLTPEFLTPIADCLWQVQAKVASHVRPHEGDNDWVAGCTAYARRCAALEKMQLDRRYKDWLWAGYVDGQFTIKIHGFPIRIYRAPEEGAVPSNYADGTPHETLWIGTLFALDVANVPRVFYRIEVVAKHLAKPVSIALVQVDELTGRVLQSYAIPRSPAGTEHGVAHVRPIRRRQPAVVPPPTEVTPKEEKNQRPALANHEENSA